VPAPAVLEGTHFDTSLFARSLLEAELALLSETVAPGRSGYWPITQAFDTLFRLTALAVTECPFPSLTT
jgi:hypothetical protein